MAPANMIVLDCDPGVDDALALALALASPELDVRAVTTVAGNATVDLTTSNALRFLAACGRTDVPVASGAHRALVHAYDHGLPPPHGENGVGGADLPGRTTSAVPEHAVYVLRDVLRAAGTRSVTIAATAPLTNIALLACLHPELLDRVQRVVVMGGSASRGNITPVAEFNTWTDPEAAQRVLTDPALEICLVGLDVTRQATLTEAHLHTLRQRSALGSLLADMVWGYRDRNEQGWPIHDALVIAAIVDPSLLQTKPASVEVDTGTGTSRGQTVCEFAEPNDAWVAGKGRYASAGRVQVAVEIDVEGFQRLMMDRLAWPQAADAVFAGH